MAIARFPSIVIDCPDPGALATFYGALLDWRVDVSADWAEIRADYGQCICFQQVAGYTPPRWPAQEVPQQMHLDVNVDDLDTAEAAVLELGATKHEHQPGTSFRVFLDPAGHPFASASTDHTARDVRPFAKRRAGPHDARRRISRGRIAMRALRTLTATGLAAATLVTAFPSAASATEVELHARLYGSTAFPRATGFSDYERGSTHREVEVTVSHIARLAGRRVTVYVNLHKVGTMLVSTAGIAHREWSTEHGQYVPKAYAGSPIRVRTATGRLVAQGRYHRVYHHD